MFAEGIREPITIAVDLSRIGVHEFVDRYGYIGGATSRYTSPLGLRIRGLVVDITIDDVYNS